MSKIIEQVIMQCTTGGHNKQYTVQLVETAPGKFMCIGWNGGIGKSQVQQLKTKTPTSRAAAEIIYKQVVAEKLGKKVDPYHVVADPSAKSAPKIVTPIVTKVAVKSSGIMPMLPKAIDKADAFKLISDNKWAMQVKENGDKKLMSKAAGKVTGINKAGNLTTLPGQVVQFCSQLPDGTVVDAEGFSDHLKAYDLLTYDGEDLRGKSFQERYVQLQRLAGKDPSIKVVHTAWTYADKMLMWREVERTDGEGVIFKLKSAIYMPGETDVILKCKFWADAEFIVAELTGKNSVKVAAKNADGEFQIVGKVTIPANHTIPAIGQIVEVRYLYYQKALVQSIYRGPRDDKFAPAEISDLKKSH